MRAQHARLEAVRTWMSNHRAGERLARHRHAEGYAALVLGGGYVEAGDNGRIRVQPGQVVVHNAHEAHQDDFSSVGAQVLNITLVEGLDVVTGMVKDPDAIAGLAERDIAGAAALLKDAIQPLDAQLSDWPDMLAAALASTAEFSIEDWADGMNLAPQSISRGFRRAYGVNPQRYRLEQRTLRAIRKLHAWRGTMAALAAELGFSDQAHLTRAVVALTGLPPNRLKVKCIQGGACTSG
jgi:AraC-like DNA-binding protein